MPEPPYRFKQTSDGIRLRYNHWRCQTGKGSGTVFILGGRAEFMEKYHETIGEITSRGFDAFGFDWRGQGGSQRLLGERSKGYVQNYGHYINDLQEIFEEALSLNCPKPWFILAHSMGAHIAMHYLGQTAHGITAAILAAPMVNVNTTPLPLSILQWLSGWMIRMGLHAIVLPSVHRRDALNKSFRRNRLTSDPVRFGRVQHILRRQPQLAVGGVTFGWLAATFDAIETLHAPGYVQQVDIPILMVLAGDDKIVSNSATQALAGKLPNKRIFTIPEARHEILQERDSLRQQFWQAFDLFVDKFMGSSVCRP